MMVLSLAVLLTVLLQPSLAGVGWSAYGDIRTGRVSMLSGAMFSSASIPVSYNITYDNSISSTLSSGIGIVGFNTYLTNYFSTNITISNFTSSNMGITVYALDDTVIIDLSINYIAVGTNTYFLDVQTSCFLPSVLSSNNDSRTETRTGTTFFVNQAVLCNVFLSGFRVYNSLGLVNTLSAQVSCSNTNSYLNYTFTATQNNTVSLICYTTIVFCDVCTKLTYFQWGQIGQNTLTQTTTPSSISISSSNPEYQKGGSGGNDRTFWGINTFNVSRGINRLFNFQSDYYVGNVGNQNYNYLTNSGTYSLILAHFFIATRSCNITAKEWFQVDPSGYLSCQTTCTNHTSYTLNGTAQFCAQCNYTCATNQCNGANNCTACDPTMYRTLTSNTCPCNSGYIDVGVPLCARCQDYITGCNTCVSTSICTQCFNGFYILAGTCQCTTGFLVTGVCTTIYGCISATNLAGTVYCLSCNASIYYTLQSSNHTCVCMSGYYVDIYGNCIGKCGDKILAYGEECDDGNTVSDDGCSSTCKVQANTTCINNPMPSNCVWNYNVTGSVAYVRRILDQNQVEIALTLSPPNSFYKSLDWSFHLQTDLPCVNTPTISHDGTYLYITCYYNQSIEGNTYNFTLQMDTYYYLSNSYLSASIPALGMNAKLTYDNNYGLSNIQSTLVMVVSILALLIMFISTITQRMIGVECIQTFQTVLYAQCCMYIAPSSIAPLQNLRYSNGYNYLFGTDYARLYKFDFIIGQVGLDNEFLVSFNLSYVILFIVVAAILLLKAIMLKFDSDRKREEKQYNREFSMEQIHPSYTNIKKVYKIVFERIFFVVAFWCMFLVLFALVVQYTLGTTMVYVVSNQFNGLLSIVAVVIILGFLTIVIINGLFPKLRIFPMFMDSRYPVYYTLYNLAYIIIIIGTYKLNAVPYILAAMTVINIIVLAIWRPYPQHIHNVVILLEQVTIVLSIGIYLYEDFTAPLENNESLFTIGFFAILFLLVAVDILSVIRLYKYWRYMKDNNLSYNDPGDKDDKDEEKALVTPNSKQNEDNLNGQTKKQVKSTKGLSGLFKPFQDNYYEDLKQSSKNPLKPQQTQRNQKSKLQINQDDYETFSKKKQSRRQPNSFYITPIDPNPREVIRTDNNNPPYDQFGNVKLHNKVSGEQQYDALKAIKARLRKDFYQKVHGVDYVPPKQENKAEENLSNGPENFEPSDQNDEE